MPGKTRKVNNDNPGNHPHTTPTQWTLNCSMNCFSYSGNRHFFQVFSGVQPRKQEKRRKSKKEPRVGFNLLIPYRLYVRLKNYVELYADRGESITEIILTGLEKELKKRYAKKIFSEEKQTDTRSRNN